jgi:haloalkane dehalogenase
LPYSLFTAHTDLIKIKTDNDMKDWWQITFPKGRQNLIIKDANGYPVQIAYG